MPLPADMLGDASIQDEVGWCIQDFPSAIGKARVHKLACLGGQFQFRFDDATYELYWLNADSEERRPHEPWDIFVGRSLSEVSEAFSRLCGSIDFEKEISDSKFLQSKRDAGIDLMKHFWFVAYFETEISYAAINRTRRA